MPAETTGFPELIKRIKRMRTKDKLTGDKLEIVIGYKAPYAVYVHENLEAYHPVGQAKFLEVAIRRLAPVLRDMVVSKVRAKVSLRDALMQAAQYLLQESKKLVPVKTGLLRDSGFVEVVEKK